MKVAFQIEAIETSDPKTTSSLYLIQEANRRGYQVWHYLPQHLSVDNNGVFALAAPVTIDLSQEVFYDLGAYKKTYLGDFDVVWLRQHPPFDMTYITTTYLLDMLKKNGVLVTNDPTGVRNFTEKLSIFEFAQHIPPTLVTRSFHEIEAFVGEHKDVIVKPLYYYGSRGIGRIQNAHDIHPFLAEFPEPLMLQAFLPAIDQGSKRIVLFDGEIICGSARVPDEGDYLLLSYTRSYAAEPTEKERIICAEVGAFSKQHGLHFVGLDFIGEHLIEINVTCPGGLPDLNRLSGRKLEAELWDVISAQAQRYRR